MKIPARKGPKKETVLPPLERPTAVWALERANYGDPSAPLDVLQIYATRELPTSILREIEGFVLNSMIRLTFSEQGLMVLGYGGPRGTPRFGEMRKEQLTQWVDDLWSEYRINGLQTPRRDQLRRYLTGIMKSASKLRKLRAALRTRRRGRPPLDPFVSNFDLFLTVEDYRRSGHARNEALKMAKGVLQLSYHTVRKRYVAFTTSPDFAVIADEIREYRQAERDRLRKRKNTRNSIADLSERKKRQQAASLMCRWKRH